MGERYRVFVGGLPWCVLRTYSGGLNCLGGRDYFLQVFFIVAKMKDQKERKRQQKGIARRAR